MRCYIATIGNNVYMNGWQACYQWAKDHIKTNSSHIVKIHLARAGEKTMRIVAEVSDDGIKHISDGRYVPLKAIRGKHG